ncbi:MAG: AtpZ/AtpI family protein [Pseudomonadota bacterium]
MSKPDPDGDESGAAHDERLERLRAKLDASRKQETVAQKNHQASAESKKSMAQAFRLSSEFIAGIVVGGGIGYLIDTVFGTSPWGLIVFLLLGFCAAVVNVLRAAGMMVRGSYETVTPIVRSEDVSEDGKQPNFSGNPSGKSDVQD